LDQFYPNILADYDEFGGRGDPREALGTLALGYHGLRGTAPTHATGGSHMNTRRDLVAGLGVATRGVSAPQQPGIRSTVAGPRDTYGTLTHRQA